MDHSVFIEATEALAEQAKLRRHWSRKYQWRARNWIKGLKPTSAKEQPAAIIKTLENKIATLQAAIQVQDEQRARSQNWIERTWLACSQSLDGHRISLEYYQRALSHAKMQQAYEEKNWQGVIELKQQQNTKRSIRPNWLYQQQSKLLKPEPNLFSRIAMRIKRLRGDNMQSNEIMKLETLLRKITVGAFSLVGSASIDEKEILEKSLQQAEQQYRQVLASTQNSDTQKELEKTYSEWKKVHDTAWTHLLDLMRQKRQQRVYKELALMGVEELEAVTDDPIKLKRVFSQAQCQLNVMLLAQWFHPTSDVELSMEANKRYRLAHEQLVETYQRQYRAITKNKLGKEEQKIITQGMVQSSQMAQSRQKQDAEFIRILNHYHAQLLAALQTEEASNGERVQGATAHLSVLVAIGQQKVTNCKASVELMESLTKMTTVLTKMSRVHHFILACNEAEKQVKQFVVMVEEQKSIFLNRFVLAMRQVRKEYQDLLSAAKLEAEIGISAEEMVIARTASVKQYLEKQKPVLRGVVLNYDARIDLNMAADKIEWIYKMLSAEVGITVLHEKLRIYVLEFMQRYAEKAENHFYLMHAALLADQKFIEMEQQFNKAIKNHLAIHHSDQVKRNSKLDEYCEENSIESSKRVTELKANFKRYISLGDAENCVGFIEWKKSTTLMTAPKGQKNQMEEEYQCCRTTQPLFKQLLAHKYSSLDMREYRVNEYQNKIKNDIPVIRSEQQTILAAMEEQITRLQEEERQHSEERKQIQKEIELLDLQTMQHKLAKEQSLLREAQERAAKEDERAEKEAALKRLAELEAQVAAMQGSATASVVVERGFFANKADNQVSGTLAEKQTMRAELQTTTTVIATNPQ